MDRAFADTGYWIALLSPRDELHSKAVSFARQFESAEVVTSEMVLVEFLNTFSDRGPHLRFAASGLVHSARSSPRVRVIPQTADLFGRALIRYQERQELEPHRLRKFSDYARRRPHIRAHSRQALRTGGISRAIALIETSSAPYTAAFNSSATRAI